ncbi:hypothetical protein BJA5080_06591 [Bradyrhizobium diazoefficiens SEMIA 5080]|uniref:Uncharacterized protein n=2 Tax=Bradyrhizobium diazoefficiens TaxID=1355477 RepID=A0A837CN55_9BRAD|nr:hypothetical protein BJA5080_06591 [Bradyrhizobium diazoefficiens SEMIA 5080]
MLQCRNVYAGQLGCPRAPSRRADRRRPPHLSPVRSIMIWIAMIVLLGMLMAKDLIQYPAEAISREEDFHRERLSPT